MFGATKPDTKEASTVGVDSGEHEGGKDKYLEDDDKSRTDEPEWARIKEKYDKPKLVRIELRKKTHGIFLRAVFFTADRILPWLVWL